MAFTIANWGCQQPSMNAGQETVNAVVLNTCNVFTYVSPNDAVATITASNYFLTMYAALSVGDIIWGSGTDAAFAVQVTASTSTSVTVASMGLTTSIGTANIVDGAVTAAKLATDSVTTIKILANNVTSAKLALNLLQYTTVAITAAQFNGMYAAPKLLVAAGGANTLIAFEQMQLLMTYVSANYAAGGVVAVQYDSTANGAGVICSATQTAAAFQAAASTGFRFGGATTVAETFTTCVNKGLYLSNVTGAFTTGDSTFVAHVWYRIIPTV